MMLNRKDLRVLQISSVYFFRSLLEKKYRERFNVVDLQTRDCALGSSIDFSVFYVLYCQLYSLAKVKSLKNIKEETKRRKYGSDKFSNKIHQ